MLHIALRATARALALAANAAARRPARWGAAAPRAAALRLRARGVSSPEGQRAGTRRGQMPPLPARTLPRLSALRKEVFGALLPLSGSPLGRRPAVAFSPLRVLPPCCAVLARLARCGRRAPAPLSRPASVVFSLALSRSRGPGRSLSPRLDRSGRVRRSAAPWPLAGPVCLRPRLRCAAGALLGCPCCAVPWALCSAWPRRVPPWSPPPGLRARGLLARGRGGFAAVCSASPPVSFLLACCARCAYLRRGFSPCAPPPRRPPLGGSGEREASGLGGRGPRCFAAPPGWVRQAVRVPIVAAPARLKPGAFAALPSPLRFFWRKALTSVNICATMVVRGPTRALRRSTAVLLNCTCYAVSVGGIKNSGRNAGVLFLPVLSAAFAHSFGRVRRPFPLRSKGNFPSKLSGNCQPGFRLNFPQAHFSALDIQKGGVSTPPLFCSAANRDVSRQLLIPR